MSSFNFINDLLTPALIKEYHTIPAEHKAGMVRLHLNPRLKKDKNYEVFLPFYYFRSIPSLKRNDTKLFVEPENWFISNKGRVLSLRQSSRGRILRPFTDLFGHQQLVYGSSDGKRFTFTLGRAVGCVFVPCHQNHPKDMEVRHRDKDLSNADALNLHWAEPGF